jgi:hypothetical protein
VASKDGYFVSSNFARDPQSDEDRDAGVRSQQPVQLAQRPPRDVGKEDRAGQGAHRHRDCGAVSSPTTTTAITGKTEADQRSLCGHVDKVKEGVPEFDWGPYYPGGAVTGKVADSDMAETCRWWRTRGIPAARTFWLRRSWPRIRSTLPEADPERHEVRPVDAVCNGREEVALAQNAGFSRRLVAQFEGYGLQLVH